MTDTTITSFPFSRRPGRSRPITPQNRAAAVRTADPANGLVRVEAAAGDHDVCFFVVKVGWFGTGRIVLGCHETLEQAEDAALGYARRQHCLYAPSWTEGSK